jgi:hypothetical protein
MSSQSNTPSNFAPPPEKYGGIQWNFRYDNIRFTNTCPLDSTLILLYGPFKARLLLKNYGELLEQDSFMSYTFNLLDNHQHDEARARWIKRCHASEPPVKAWLEGNSPTKIDIFGEATRYFVNDNSCPFASSSTMWYTPTITCLHPGGCRRGGDNTRTEASVPTAFFQWVTHNEQGEIIPLATHLNNEKFDKIYSTCKLRGPSMQTCPGPSQVVREIISWPHCIFVDIPCVEDKYYDTGRYMHLSQLNLVERLDDHFLVLRGCLLGDGGHFTTVLRLPNGWLHYDGMQNPCKYTYYALDRADSAMRRRTITKIMYECVHTSATSGASIVSLFGDPSIDYNTVFAVSNHVPPLAAQNDGVVGAESSAEVDSGAEEPPVQARELEEDGESEKDDADTTSSLGSLAEPIFRAQHHAPVDRGQKRNSRVTLGWSVPRTIPSSGPRPVCPGCNMEVDHGEERLRYKFLEKPNHMFPTVKQYHMKTKCLIDQPPQRLKQFLEKKWSNSRVTELQAQVQAHLDQQGR